MTRSARKGPRRIDINNLDLEQRIYFEKGFKYFPEPLFQSDQQMWQAWRMHRAALISKWRQEHGEDFVSWAERTFDNVETDQPLYFGLENQ